MKEIFKDIVNYEGYYTVSNLGRVRSIKNNLILHNIWRGGYEVVNLSRPGVKAKTIAVHRLVAKAFIPNPYHLPVVHHKDDNDLNNRSDNLIWCSASDNNKLYWAKKRSSS